MAEDKKGTNVDVEDLRKLDNVFRRTMSSLNSNIDSTLTRNSDEIDAANALIKKILDEELKQTTNVTSDDIVGFINSMLREQDKYGATKDKSFEQMFINEADLMASFLEGSFRNRSALYADLEMIADKLYELEEAVNATRDAIITPDDMTQTISRTLSFKHSTSETNIEGYKELIERVETELNLPANIKNKIIKNTLINGDYYAYTIPYSALFERKYRNLENNGFGNVKYLKESIDEDYLKGFTDSKERSDFNTIVENITVSNKHIPLPLLENMDLDRLNESNTGLNDITNSDQFKLMLGKVAPSAKLKKPVTNDGVEKKYNSLGYEPDKISEEFAEVDVKGCYIQYIHPSKMIPVKIMDSVLGYYYVYSTDDISSQMFSSSNRISTMTTSLFSTMNSRDMNSNSMVDRVADLIIQSFDIPFIQKNAKFKQLLSNAIRYDDMYKKKMKFQFIQADYITHYKIDEDENGNGQSILLKSLFYGKLYLALLLFKMVSIFSKSNDTRVTYIKNSGIDKNIVNATQAVVRDHRIRQLDWNDMDNFTTLTSKIGANKEMYVPVGRTGDRAVEFDILSGQDVQLNTDLMDMLRQGYISATGVPSVLMNYINEADYSRTLVMGNTKFLGRVASHQLDFNPDLTIFYKKIMRYSELSIPDNIIDTFVYTLNPPKILNANTLSEMVSTATGISEAIVKAQTGEESNDVVNKARDIMHLKVLQDYVPGIDWGRMNSLYKDSIIEAKQVLRNKVNDGDSGY